MEPVGADDHASVIRCPLPVARARHDTHDGSTIPDQIFHRRALADLGAGAGSGRDENRVERRTRQREAIGSRSVDEPAAHRRPVRCNHLHAIELGVRRRLDRDEDALAQPLEDRRRGRAQVFGAGFVARKPGAVEDQHSGTRSSE